MTVAEVNLKFIWDVVSQIKVGKDGHAYVVDVRGNLIAHPDISLVLQKTNLASLAQVVTARAARPPAGRRARGGGDRPRPRRPPGSHGVGDDHAAGLAGPGRPAAGGSLRARVRVDVPDGRPGGDRSRAGLAGQPVPRPSHGDADPGARGGRRPPRGRGARRAHRRADRRRAGRAGPAVQQHGRAAPGVVREPGGEGRAAHPRAVPGPRAADGDGGDPARDLQLADRHPARPDRRGRERHAASATPSVRQHLLRSRATAAVDGAARASPDRWPGETASHHPRLGHGPSLLDGRLVHVHGPARRTRVGVPGYARDLQSHGIGRFSGSPCCARACRSASITIRRLEVRPSRTSRSRCSRPLPTRPSSPSRTCACSASWPGPSRSCAASARWARRSARRSIWRTCSRRSPLTPTSSPGRTAGRSTSTTRRPNGSTCERPSGSRKSWWRSRGPHRSRWGKAGSAGRPSPGSRCRFPTSRRKAPTRGRCAT